MRPPEHICKSIERIHKWARLGWHGSDTDGRFALLDLYPAPLAARSFELHWEDRGPVYGSPYDAMMRVPIVKGWFHPQHVYSGELVRDLRRMRSSLVERVRKHNEKRIREEQARKKDLAGEAGEELYWNAQKSNHTGPIVAKKHLSKQEKAVLSGDWREHVPEEKPMLPSGLGMT